MARRAITRGIIAAALIGAGVAAVHSVARAQPESKPVQPAAQPSPASQPDQAPKEAKPARAPTLIALKFYADWCPLCKAMMPAVMETEKKAADKSVLFVKLDQTDKDSHQAEYLLAALGMGNLWTEHAGKTGYILLMDPESERVVGRVNSDMDAAAMGKAIDDAFAACGPGGEHPNADHPKRK